MSLKPMDKEDTRAERDKQLSLDYCSYNEFVDAGICCHLCERLFHPECVAIASAHLKIFEDKQYMWFCSSCKQGCKKRIKELELENEVIN